MEIGAKGLAEANIILPQDTSLVFDVVHKDESGHVINHSGSTAHMAFQSKDKATTYDLDACCACSAERIRVMIPASTSETLPLGKLNWDLIVVTATGEQIRLCYGVASVVDTYAMDDEV